MASETTEPSADLSDLGARFSSNLQNLTEAEDQEKNLEAFVADIYQAPLSAIRKRAKEESDEKFREAYADAYDYQVNQLVQQLTEAGGYEETLRILAPLTRSGALDQEDIDAVLPLVIQQARKPLPDLLDRETLLAAGVAIPQAIGDLAKGAYGLAKYAPSAAVDLTKVMGQTGEVPGTPVKPGEGLGSVWRRLQEMKQAAGGAPALSVLEAATIQGTRESARLAQRLGRTLFSDVGDYSDEALGDRFQKDLKAYEFFSAIEDGSAYPELSEDEVEYIQSIGEIADATNFIPFGFGLKVVKRGSKTASALRVGAEKAAKAEVGAVRKAVGDVVESLGKSADKAAGKAAKSPVIAGGITLIATGGDLTSAGIAALTASTTEGSKAVARLVGAPAKAVEAVGRAIKTPVTGPAAAAAGLAKEYGLASLYGAGAMLPYAAIAETSEEAGTLLGGGAGAAGLGAAVGQGTRGIKTFGQSMWAPSKPAPANAPRSVVTSYGTEFDANHEAYANVLTADEVNRIEALRDLIGPNNRLYVLSPEAYDALPNLAGTNGVANFKDNQGVNTTLVRGGTESLLHETGHVVTNSLTDEQKAGLYDAVRTAYGPDGLKQMRDYYESLGVQLRDDVSLLEEVLAENFQVALNGGPLSNLGTPRSLAAKIYSLFGETTENLGLRDLKMGGDVVTSETLQYTPSFLVQKAIRNVMDAINLDEAAPVELKTANGTVTRVPAKKPTEIDVGVATKVPAELIEQSPIPVPGSISGIRTDQKPPVKQRPNVRVTRGQQEGFIPPTPEQQAINTQRLQELADRPRNEQAYVETEYFAAEPVTGTEPDAPRRLAQRQLADKAEAEYPGYSNPLRAPFQKIFAPYKNLGGNKIIGFSFDKLIQNLDILAGWVGEQITAGKDVQLPYDLSSPELRRDVQTYLQNHANGYAGDGRRLQRPADTVPGTIPDENPGYTPVPLEPVKAQFINLLMGLEPPKKTTVPAAFNRRFAEQNGLAVTETPTGSPEVNILRAQLRDLGFDSSLLNGVLEVLRTDRITGEIKERPDINLGVGEGAFIRAGFMPAEAAKTSPGNPQAQESKKRTASMAVRSVAEDYMRDAGLPYTPHEDYAPVNEDLAKRLSDFYEQAESAPDDPEVQSAYRSLADETMAQYRAMEAAGIQIEPWEGKGEPYANSAEMLKDVRDNKHLWFFTTESGFGKGETVPNALLEDSGVVINGKPLVINDVFRAVHDYFGHAKEGYEFGPRGEFNAYLAHSRMFSDAAKPALASETLAQNSWVNFGPHLRREDGSLPKSGEQGFVPIKNRPFADQKNLVIPDELLTEADQVAGQFMPAERDGKPLESEGLRVGGMIENDAAEVFGEDTLPGQTSEASAQFMPAPPVESEAFKTWFGDWEDPKAYTSRQKGPVSMVTERVDGRIQPQIVYHGTSADFTEFNPTGKGVVDFGFLGAFDVERSGVFFTSNPEAASTFAQGAGGNVIPAYLDIKGPADLTTPDNIYDVMEELGLNGRVAFQAGFKPWELFDGPEGKEFVAKLKEVGYDGAQLKEYMPDVDRAVDVWVAFDPAQIKSATGNIGTFDPSNPDIRYMPKESLTTQFESKKKRGSMSGVQHLVHFSSRKMTTLDPKKSSGKGAATPTDLRGMKRGYFYRIKKGAYESGIADRSYTYVADIDGNSIYDLSKDPLNYRGMANREKADKMLIDAGFAGMRGKVGAIDMVAMFKPVKVTEATTEDVYTKKQLAEQRRQRAPLEEEEIDYQAEYEAWEVERARRWPTGQFMPGVNQTPTRKLTAESVGQFMPAAPRVDLTDYIGRDVVSLTTDRLDVGEKEVGPEGAKRVLSRKAQGGRGFPLVYTGTGWAFSNKESASRFLTRLRISSESSSALVATSVLDEKNVLNSPFGQLAIATAYRNAVESGFVTEQQANATIKEVFSRAAAAAKDKDMAKIKTLVDYEKAVEAWPFSFGKTRQIVKRLNAATLKIPREIRQAVGLDAISVARSISDPELAGLPNFAFVSMMEIPLDQVPVKDDVHFSYPYSVKGRLLGFLKTPFLAEKLIDSQRVYNRRGKLSAQPMMTVMPSIDALKPSEINPDPESRLQSARIPYAAPLGAETVVK